MTCPIPPPLILLLAALLLPAAAPLPAVPAYREFGRWFVACDNTRACVARGFDHGTRAQLEMTRKAGDAPANLRFYAEHQVVPGELRLDGAPVALPAPVWSNRHGALSTSDPAAITAFIAAARNGRTITLDLDASNNERPRTVPLDGFAAALLLVDAVQGRPGTRTALIAAGGEAVPPPAPPLPRAPRWTVPPRLTRAETQRLMQQAGTLPSQTFDPCDAKDPSLVYPLDAVDALAIRPCYTAAYQGSSVTALLPRAGGPARPATPALPGLPRSRAVGMDMVDPRFDPATGNLFSFSKGRGLADCGSSEVWVWSGGGFRLQSWSFQGMCGGTEAGDWPPLYRTR